MIGGAWRRNGLEQQACSAVRTACESADSSAAVARAMTLERAASWTASAVAVSAAETSAPPAGSGTESAGDATVFAASSAETAPGS